MTKPNQTARGAGEAVRSPASFSTKRKQNAELYSELRHNQTIPVPLNVRSKLCEQELPGLPPEYNRTTGDQTEAMQQLLGSQPPKRPVEPPSTSSSDSVSSQQTQIPKRARLAALALLMALVGLLMMVLLRNREAPSSAEVAPRKPPPTHVSTAPLSVAPPPTTDAERALPASSEEVAPKAQKALAPRSELPRTRQAARHAGRKTPLPAAPQETTPAPADHADSPPTVPTSDALLFNPQ